MNEMNKGLRGLGGTKMVTQYSDVVVAVFAAIEDISDDNGCNFETNLALYLEGLEMDVMDYFDSPEDVACIPRTKDTTYLDKG